MSHDRLVRVANDHGHGSHHVVHLNLAGLEDWDAVSVGRLNPQVHAD
jgi:hypothetical protein